MYVRILIVCSLFNLRLGGLLVLPLLVLAAASALFAWQRARSATVSQKPTTFKNPLQLSTAFVFALLFVAISMLTTLAHAHLGRAGIFALAGIVGVTDIDPFVLSLAQGGAPGVGLTTAASAIVIAASSNDVLKAIYALAFSGRRESLIPAAQLGVLAVIGVAIALFYIR
jgi:uncharacterized membrane protein (DUF4010 family)